MAEKDGLRAKCRAWLCGGGAGHEDGEDGIRAGMISMEGAIEMAADAVLALLESKYEALVPKRPRYWIEPYDGCCISAIGPDGCKWGAIYISEKAVPNARQLAEELRDKLNQEDR